MQSHNLRRAMRCNENSEPITERGREARREHDLAAFHPAPAITSSLEIQHYRLKYRNAFCTRMGPGEPTIRQYMQEPGITAILMAMHMAGRAAIHGCTTGTTRHFTRLAFALYIIQNNPPPGTQTPCTTMQVQCKPATPRAIAGKAPRSLAVTREGRAVTKPASQSHNLILEMLGNTEGGGDADAMHRLRLK